MSRTEQPALRLGGITPLTTVDYPDRLAAVLFCQGCPWRCRYCHNTHLLERDRRPALVWASVRAFLKRRSGLLDAVVFSGGEPTAQSPLSEAVSEVRALGFHVGLHTSGAYPKRLGRLLDRLDWVGLDIKALPDDYPQLTGVADSGERAWQSLRVLRDSGVPFDVRITVHHQLLPPAKLAALLRKLAAEGIDEPVVQACRSETMLDPALGPNAFVPATLDQMRAA